MKPACLRSIPRLLRYKAVRLVCVYFLCWKGKVIYVGSSRNFATRLSEHRVCIQHDDVFILPCGKLQLGKLERYFIRLLSPRLNHSHNPRVYNEIKYAHESTTAAAVRSLIEEKNA